MSCRRVVFFIVAGFFLVSAFVYGAGSEVKGMDKPVVVKIKSTLDGSDCPTYFYVPEVDDGAKIPLLVALHTWSYNYQAREPREWAFNECRNRKWAMLHPDFRGPNSSPKACGSDYAVQDILDAVEFAKANAPIDTNRIYLIGMSGGGMMSLLMAGRHPDIWAGVYSGCPISDIARWHSDSVRLKNHGYAKQIEAACGGNPADAVEEYRLRSPLTYLAAARKNKVHIQIATGIHDGHIGSVPVGHAIRAYNMLADDGDRISEDDIAIIERERKVPVSLQFDGSDPFFGPKLAIHLRKTSANVRLTIFEGGHSGNFNAGIDWLARQRRGNTVDWTLPAVGDGAETHATK